MFLHHLRNVELSEESNCIRDRSHITGGGGGGGGGVKMSQKLITFYVNDP